MSKSSVILRSRRPWCHWMDIAFKCTRCNLTYLSVTDDFHLLPIVIGQQLIPRRYNESANPRIDTIEEFIPEFDP